ncbi:DUF3658 domain-containing protein [Lysobacter psychrotolerans]|uniref:DUF3658 domain-containing protein n=1 Tax=Montanilutibacter psychrotolerans TaxID=1327343 RepID=UPI001CC21DA4
MAVSRWALTFIQAETASRFGLIQALGLIRTFTTTFADEHDDPPLDADDLRAVAALTQDDLRAIDRALLASSSADWRKVALVAAVAMDAYPDQYDGIPDVFYSQRVRDLVSSGYLEARGNLYRMRFSEVRLTPLGLGHEA